MQKRQTYQPKRTVVYWFPYNKKFEYHNGSRLCFTWIFGYYLFLRTGPRQDFHVCPPPFCLVPFFLEIRCLQTFPLLYFRITVTYKLKRVWFPRYSNDLPVNGDDPYYKRKKWNFRHQWQMNWVDILKQDLCTLFQIKLQMSTCLSMSKNSDGPRDEKLGEVKVTEYSKMDGFM